MSQPAISKHLKVLERAGLISRRREAQRRPCHLEGQQLRMVVDWLEPYRSYWAESARDMVLTPPMERGVGDALDNVGFMFFEDPEGNHWAVQQISSRG